MKPWLRKVDALLGLAERSIALLERCRPLNMAEETARMSQLWQRGCPRSPAWVYAYAPDFAHLRSELGLVAQTLEQGDDVEQLYAARARELGVEASLAEAIGQPDFCELARQRFPLTPEGSKATCLARRWASLSLSSACRKRFQSDDPNAPHSLLAQMLAQVARLRLPIRVVLRQELQSVAAASEETVFIKPGVSLSRTEARRIVLHELWGHVMPRLSARSSPLGLLRVGSARGADDEEGRALWLESRLGLMGRERQAELGRRHLAASAVAQGADWVETVRLLIEQGASTENAIGVASRVQRGGGLARELVYLPAWARVAEAFCEEPELADWLAQGRLDIQAARVLHRVRPQLLGSVPGAKSVFEFHE